MSEVQKIELTKDERDDFEERAGILQFSANMSREEAEKKAMEMVTKKGNSTIATPLLGQSALRV